MRKLLALVFASVAVLGLVGCQSGGDVGSNDVKKWQQEGAGGEKIETTPSDNRGDDR